MTQPRGPRPVVLNDLVGQTFTRWTVTSRNLDQPVRGVFWNVTCTCGKTGVVVTGNLKAGLSKSCGCLSRERTSEVMKTHGKSRTKVWRAWQGIRTRCRNSKVREYANYGGRGITVCDEWYDSFVTFYAAVGDPPTTNHTIERKDVNGNYEPGNVIWIPSEEQALNKRRSVLYTHNGVTKNLTTWAKEHGLSYGILHYRLFTRKMSFEDAVSEPSLRPKSHEE